MRIAYLFIFCALTAFSVKAQSYDYPIDPKSGKILFDKEISVEGTKDQLFERGLQWIASQPFGTPEKNLAFDNVIGYQNKEEGKIFGKGKFKFDTKYPSLGYYDYSIMTFSFKIYVKDGSYRYVFTDFIVRQLAWHKRPRDFSRAFEDYKESGYYRRHSAQSIDDHLKDLRHTLKLAMTGKL